MRTYLKGAAMALVLAGAGVLATGSANADGRYGQEYGSGPRITVGFGNVAIGYRDGYWDNGHRWHHWRHHRDYRVYGGQDGSNYHNWNHDRDGNDGWQGH
jgi:hypothetical protein